MAEKVRLQKLLAQCGIASRRKAEELIEKGFVYAYVIGAHIGDTAEPVIDKLDVRVKRRSTP